MKLDRRGTTALEFALVAIPFFTILFGIIDLGRYGLTSHSLNALASASARGVMINCYSDKLIHQLSPATCTTDPFTAAQKQTIAPFLYAGGLAPTVTVTAGASTLTITATQTGFTMLMPFWGTMLNNPSASTSIPF